MRAETPTSAPLRSWQREALSRYESSRGNDFLVTATPGAGKTTFALTLAARLLAARRVARIVVVAPTDHLRTQWANAADRAGIVLDPTLSNAVGPVRGDTSGYVTTYAQVAGKPALHAARCTVAKTLVILDEVHHAGDGLSWGEATLEAFGRAARRLALTGTPFRTKPGERIPFVEYIAADDGEGTLVSRADVTYGYRQALADGVVRPVVFAAYTGTARWRNSAGDVVAASLSEPSTRDVEATAWRTVLDPKGQWVPHVIAAMDDRLTHLRQRGMPDAAGLVLASDIEDARAYADIVTRVTGASPALILSDDARASARLEEFTHSTQRIAVCVRMVSEGVDVPRAAVLAWMTSYRTPLFFAQAVGRVVRARGSHESATVFLPAVRPLLTLAAAVEEERNHVLAAPVAGEELEVSGPRERAAAESREWVALDAEAQFAHVLHGGRAVLAADVGEAVTSPEDEDFLGLPGLLTAEQTAALLHSRDEDARTRAASARRGHEAGPAVHPHRQPAGDSSAAWQAASDLRREVNRLVASLARRTGEPHARVHVALRRAVPGPPSASASAELLARRRDHLLAQM